MKDVQESDFLRVFQSPEWLFESEYFTFTSGGVKGVIYAGAMVALDEEFLKRGRNMYQQIKGFAGSSIGAIFALFLTLGIRGRKLYREVLAHDLSDITNEISLDSLTQNYGLNDSKKNLQRIYDIIESYTGDGNITFAKLYELTGKHFVCSVSNVTTGKSELHSHLTTPHFKVYTSVVASACVPIIMSPVIIQGQYYVDGGLMDNSPMWQFPLHQTTLFYLEWDNHVPTNFVNYMRRLALHVITTSEKVRFERIPPELAHRKVILSTQGVNPLHFNMSLQEKNLLMTRGKIAMKEFIYPRLVWNKIHRVLLLALVYATLDTTLQTSHQMNHKNEASAERTPSGFNLSPKSVIGSPPEETNLLQRLLGQAALWFNQVRAQPPVVKLPSISRLTVDTTKMVHQTPARTLFQ